MNRVVHFELGVVEPQRAIEFYKNVFGWEAQQSGGQEYWLLKTGPANEPGIDGGYLRDVGHDLVRGRVGAAAPDQHEDRDERGERGDHARGASANPAPSPSENGTGGPDATRTRGLRFRKPSLYPPELRGR